MNATENKKWTFHFKVTYFRPSGKFYTSDTFAREVRNVGTEEHPSAYMSDVVAHLVGIRDNGGQGASHPGLSTVWHGYILVECDQGYPCLIPSVEADTE